MEKRVQSLSGIILGVRSTDVKTETVDESGTYTVRDDRESEFLCPKDNQVIVGRMHLGDENGKTTYKYGTLSFVNGDDKTYEFVLSDLIYSEYMEESNSDYSVPEGALLVGREHIGDENGKTRYAYRKLYVKKKNKEDAEKLILCERFYLSESEDAYVCTTKESSGEWADELRIFTSDSEPEKSYYAPMYRRSHSGDENGTTKTYFSFMKMLEDSEK